MASTNNVVEVEEIDRSSDFSESVDENVIFFSDDLILSLVDGIVDIEDIQSLCIRLNISHTVFEHYKQTHGDLFELGVNILRLWREVNNLGDFESCRLLQKNLNELGHRFKSSQLISSFIQWCTTKMCCCNRVHDHALATIGQFQKRNQSLMNDVQGKFNNWCDGLDLQQNSTNMALYLQLYKADFETEERHFSKMLFNINKSLDHHLPRDAFLSTYGCTDVTSSILKKFTIISKPVTSFLHERRLMLMSGYFSDMTTVSEFGIHLNILPSKLQSIHNKNKHSVKLTAYYVLHTWKQNWSSLKEERHIHELTKALNDINYIELSEKLLKDYEAWKLQPVPTKFYQMVIAKRKISNLGQNSISNSASSPMKISKALLPPNG
uniref:Death domain-containing protein n=1 Tax=Octopus bimaculoides TaxID=37653 RepID=A0A0L8I7J0_OCTBM